MRIFAVVVLYKMTPSQSPTLQSLDKSVRSLTASNDKLSILVWDNTPNGPPQMGELPEDWQYISAPRNPGLSCAYNCARMIAETQGYEWLLTLDQDTVLPSRFLPDIFELAIQLEDEHNVAAILPRIIDSNRLLSPFVFMQDSFPRVLPNEFIGIPSTATYAVNSAATLRISSLSEVKGYNPLFPLDLSDLDLFHRLHRSGKSVFVARDLVVQHDFSILKKHTSMSVDRYRDQLRDECAFWDINMGTLARVERIVRLVAVVCKDMLKPNMSAFQVETITEIKRRLTVPRARRIAEWKAWAQSRYAANNEQLAV